MGMHYQTRGKPKAMADGTTRWNGKRKREEGKDAIENFYSEKNSNIIMGRGESNKMQCNIFSHLYTVNPKHEQCPKLSKAS